MRDAKATALNRVRKEASAPPGKAREQTGTVTAWRHALRGAIVGLLLVLVVLPGFAFFQGVASYAIPFVAGAVLGLVVVDYTAAVAGSVVFGAVLALVAPRWLSYSAVVTAINDAGGTAAGIKAHFVGIVRSLFDNVWLPTVGHATAGSPAFTWLPILAVGICAVASCGVSLAVRSDGLERFELSRRLPQRLATTRRLIGLVLMVGVLGGLLVSANASAVSVRDQADQYLSKGSYSDDYAIYIRTVQDMARGKGYYNALGAAVADDARAGRPDHYSMPKASWVRLPALPTALVLLFGQRLSLAVTLGLLLGAIGAGIIGLALERQLFPGAGTIVALLVMPYVAMTGTWQSAFLPDYWGGILILIAFGLLLDRLTYPAIAVTLLAALTREHIWLWVFALLLGLVWLGVARKRWLPAVVTAGGFAAVVAAYAAHWRAVNTTYSWLLSGTAAGSGLLGVTAAWTGLAPAMARLNTVTDFAIGPYTLYRYSSSLLLLAGAAFLGLRVVRAIRARRVAVAESTALLFLGMMIAAVLALPYFSQYWALMFVPLALAACAGLVGELVKATALIEAPSGG